MIYLVEDEYGETQLYNFSYTESQNPSNSPFAVANCELLIQYEVLQSTRIYVGLNYIGFGNSSPNYKFLNYGTNASGEEMKLNDIEIHNRTLFTQVGASYRFIL